MRTRRDEEKEAARGAGIISRSAAARLQLTKGYLIGA